jgi:hypothetical protein
LAAEATSAAAILTSPEAGAVAAGGADVLHSTLMLFTTSAVISMSVPASAFAVIAGIIPISDAMDSPIVTAAAPCAMAAHATKTNRKIGFIYIISLTQEMAYKEANQK